MLLEWLSDAPDPDLGLLQLRRLTEGYTRSSTVARRFRETPVAAERACRVLGLEPRARTRAAPSARVPRRARRRRRAARRADARRSSIDAALDTLDWREDDRARRDGLRRFKRRELLRIGARDLLGFADLASVGRELSNLADASVEAALQSLEPEIPFAVIGMGRLGGQRAVVRVRHRRAVRVRRRPARTTFDRAERVATRLMRAIGETTAEGQTFRIDARLRPEGKQGLLARSLAGYDAVLAATGARSWEFQALTKARLVAGDAELGRAFLELRPAVRVPRPVPRRRGGARSAA